MVYRINESNVIIISKKGNTYFGELAHILRDIANKSAREYGIPEEIALKHTIKAHRRLKAEYIKKAWDKAIS